MEEPTTRTTSNTTDQDNMHADGPGLGPAIGTIIIVAILVLGAFYFWGQKVAPRDDGSERMQTQTDVHGDQIANELRTVSPSDDLNTVQQDLENTNLDHIDAGLDELEQELNSI